MKKIQNNKKGFSLVELLIVLAILAIIAAISISIFANVLENQRQRADKGAAAFIQSAIQSYMVESGDYNLSKCNTSGGLDSVVNAMKVSINFMDPTTNESGDYGPYMKESTTSKTKSKLYKAGFEVKVNANTQSVQVKPVTTGATLTVTN